MKKFIVKSNEWYDNLPSNKRDLFFLFFILFPFLIANFITVTTEQWWVFPATIVIFCVWRVGYIFIDFLSNIK